MRIFLLANNWVGFEIAKYLKKRNENIVGLAIHEKDKQKFTKEIVTELSLPKNKIFKAQSLRNADTVKKITKLKPDIFIAAFWGYILKPQLYTIAPKGAINFHPGYLPFNRGMNPNVWPLIERTPAGVTIHYIDEGIDTGDIIARKKVAVKPTDTADEVYEKTLVEIVKLFKTTWPLIKSGENKRTPQKTLERPTMHYTKDIEKLDQLDLDKKYTMREAIDLFRARSYKNRFYLHYFDNGKKVYLRIQLSDKNE